MYLTLQNIESSNLSSPEMIKIYHLHHAIVTEVRDENNWDNALKLFTTYLAPIVVASQKAAAAATGTTVPRINSGRKYNKESSRMIDFNEKHNGNGTRQLNEEDVRLVQFAISAMVRYAPSVTESNILYMFYLQCEPPIRCDETIDKCLVSLIYQYAHSDPELQVKGKDLIEVALSRGIGLPDYKAIASRKHKLLRIQPRNDTGILRNVSEPILRLLKLQISNDGRSLVPYDWPTPNSGNSSHYHQHHSRPPQQLNQSRPPQQLNQPRSPQQQHQFRPPQQQQQYRGPQQQAQSRQQQYPQHQHQHQHQSRPQPPTSRPRPFQGSLGQLSSPPQQLQQEKGEPNTVAGKNIKKPLLKSDTAGKFASRIPEDDQYSYYQKASRRGFEGSHRDGHRGERGSFIGGSGSSSRDDRYGSKHREITFVPASINSMLKTDSLPTEDLGKVKESIQVPDTEVPATAIATATEEECPQGIQGSSLAPSDAPKEEHLEEGQDISSALAAEVEKLQLGPQSCDETSAA
ncbi:hypothetical protein BGX26_005158 [Mortierella sp. AD094]|nr:hypothetical protein BGX26_005158 [Mortierella sp. AD094]